MTDLRDALQTLAREREPEHDQISPEELWGRGVRRHRLRVAVTGLVALLVLAAGAGLGNWLPGALQPDVVPAAPPGQPRIPRSIGQPGDSVPGTDSAGPLGRLAVLWGTNRDGRPALFGISARTGQYRFLDVPRLASPEQVALSPDGRRVAYWSSGSVPGHAVPGDPLSARWKTVVGVTVYDTVTGHTAGHVVGSRHGLMPHGLWWANDDQLVFSYGFWVNRRSANDIHTYTWSVDQEEAAQKPVRLRGDPVPFDSTTPDAEGGVVFGQGSNWRQYDDLAAIESRTGRHLDLPRASYAQVTVRSDRVVAIQDGPRPGAIDGRYWLETGTVDPDGRVAELRRVGDVRATQLIGWQDDGQLLGQGVDGHGRYLLELDPATSAVRRLGTVDVARSFYGKPAFATEVVALGTADRPVPPSEPERGLGTGLGTGLGGGAALLLLVAGALVWRRRARG
jgi:hypothetical protein